jgi:hypothetical protein
VSMSVRDVRWPRRGSIWKRRQNRNPVVESPGFKLKKRDACEAARYGGLPRLADTFMLNRSEWRDATR